MSIRIYPNIEDLSEAVASNLANLSREAVATRGQFMLALSGGSTPRRLYEVLAREYSDTVPWKYVHFFWGDERYVPSDDSLSNYRLARESLLDRIPASPEKIHPIPTSFGDPKDAAHAYSEELSTTFGMAIPSFDLILLGLGEDGHTASLFSGSDIDRHSKETVIVTQSPVPPHVRISLTMKVLSAARNIFVLVSGSEKAEILGEVLQERSGSNSPHPAARLKPAGSLTWFIDKDAAGSLNG